MSLAKGVSAPVRGTKLSAALDLQANIESDVLVQPGSTVMIPTGVFIDMSADPTLAALMLPRSGLGAKQGLVLGNGVGLIDNDYTGELMVAAWNRNHMTRRVGLGAVTNESVVIEPGMRLAQLMFLNIAFPDIEVSEIEDFEETERGAEGFGSTGT